MMGIAPGFWLSSIAPGPGVKPLTPLEIEGREVYVANGCSYCHTQQVRPLPQDRVFGRPSAAGDFAYQTPELLGSERTGPDLSNIGQRQPSDVWQYIHLYNPRAVVPQSIMPPFGWLFDVVDRAPAGATTVPVPDAFAPRHGVVVPTREARALVAYLRSLKQAPLPGYDDPTGSPAAEPVAPASGARAARGAPGPGTSVAVADGDDARGKTLYASHCAACHQAGGRGLPGVFPALAGNAVVNAADAVKHIQVVLHGMQGEAVAGQVYASPMPAFADQLGDADIAAIINHERRSWGNRGTPVTADQVAAERGKQ
jgi:cytochrome c oxidase cbb3-type subunit 2